MEKISEMVERMCPEGVEYVKLGEICDCITGGDTPTDCIKGQSKPTKEYPYPVYANGDETYGYASHYRIDKPAVTISSIGNVGTAYYREAYFTPIIRLKTFIPKNRNLNIKFLYYCLSVMSFVGTNSSLSSMKAADFKKREIPLPPLSIQQEIVRILDSFASMITNLETELASRQKQYEFYRNKLLTFDKHDESVEWKTLGDIGTMHKGKGIQKADFVDEGMPCIHYGQVHTYYGFTATETKSFVSDEMYSNSNKAKKGDLIIATTSEDVEACCKSTVWLGDTEPAISGDAHYFHHNQNPRYIGYLFMTEMFAAQKRIAAVGAKVTRVHGDSILKFKFPIPTLQYQNEVVEKLDNFEALISNIKQELEARKKQYEYYREQLLTFRPSPALP